MIPAKPNKCIPAESQAILFPFIALTMLTIKHTKLISNADIADNISKFGVQGPVLYSLAQY